MRCIMISFVLIKHFFHHFRVLRRHSVGMVMALSVSVRTFAVFTLRSFPFW